MAPKTDFDEILPEIGEFGTYQKLVLWFLLVPAVFPCAFQTYNQIFMATVPEHWCELPELKEKFPNASEEILRKISIPYDNLTKSFEKCFRYDLDFHELFPEFLSENFEATEEKISYLELVQASAKIISCDSGWHYQLQEYTTSIVSDWDLVCDRAFLPTLALVLLGVGGLIGTFVFGVIQDSLGRRPAFFIYLVILCFFGLATAYTPTYGWWLACRIGVGVTVPAIIVTPMVLAVELVGPAYRTYTFVIMNIGYSCSLVLLAVIIYFVRIWPQLTLATTIPFLGFFGFWWVLPESPRWLLATGKVKEAFRIMSAMATINKKPSGQDYLACLKREIEKEEVGKGSEDETSSTGVLHLFRTPNLRKKTLILTYIWFVNMAVYTGLSYYAPYIGGDQYLNFLVIAVAELPTYIFIYFFIEYRGRRWTLCFFMVLGGTSCIATVITQNDYITTLVLYSIGKFGISSSYVVLPLFASELYPTVVRGVGMGLSSTFSMVGPIVIPLINYLGREMMVLPLIIMGSLSIVGAASSLLLPETLHQPLPQTLQDGENFGKVMTHRDYWNCCPRRNLKHRNLLKSAEESLQPNNELSKKKEEVRPSLEEDIFEESYYRSLRRNSFRKAQSESIEMDEGAGTPLTRGDPSDRFKNGSKKSKKSLNKYDMKNKTDPLMKHINRITEL